MRLASAADRAAVTTPRCSETGNEPRSEVAAERRPWDVGLPGWFAVMSCLTLVVCLAYSGGRSHERWAPVAYWIGEVLLFSAPAYVVMRRTSSWPARYVSVLLYAADLSLISWAYSPDMFRYSDELQHQRSLLNILASHHDFQLNYSLPIGAHYPGLGNVTAAVVQLTGISPFAAGQILVFISDLLVSVAVLMLFREITKSERAAAAGALVFLIGRDQSLFRLYVYETLALPFLILVLYLALKAAGARHGWRRYAVLACASALVTTITHHVTAIAQAAILVLLAVGLTLRPATRRHSMRVWTVAGTAVVMLCLWIALVAPETFSYLGDPIEEAIRGALAGRGAGTKTVAGAQGEPIEHWLSLAGPLVTVVISAIGIKWIYTRSDDSSWATTRIWALGSLSLVLLLVVRVAASGGTELAGRALAYSSLFTGCVVGYAADTYAARLVERRRRRTERHFPRPIKRASVVAASGMLLCLSGLVSGLPPAYERLPGTFNVDGFESGVDPANISAARWSLPALGPGNRVFGDFTAYALFATLGNQNTVHGDNALYAAFKATTVRKTDADAFSRLNVRYVVTDRRVTEQAPVRGTYFAGDDTSSAASVAGHITPKALQKFDQARGISRLYDNGFVRVYDLWGSVYVP